MESSSPLARTNNKGTHCGCFCCWYENDPRDSIENADVLYTQAHESLQIFNMLPALLESSSPLARTTVNRTFVYQTKVLFSCLFGHKTAKNQSKQAQIGLRIPSGAFIVFSHSRETPQNSPKCWCTFCLLTRKHKWAKSIRARGLEPFVHKKVIFK